MAAIARAREVLKTGPIEISNTTTDLDASGISGLITHRQLAQPVDRRIFACMPFCSWQGAIRAVTGNRLMRQDASPVFARDFSPRICCLAGLLCLSSAASGDSPELAMLSEEDFFAESPIVLSASRLTQPLNESPAPITVIDHDMLEAAGTVELTDALRLVPGFQIAHGSGGEQTATFHGFSDQHARRMQVTIDGRSIYNATFGGVLWSSIPLTIDEIDRIEVVRGPNGSAFGFNAFIGAINIITRHAIEDRGASLSLLAGSQRRKRSIGRLGGRFGDVDVRAQASFDQHDGFDRRNDDFRTGFFNLRADYSPSLTDAIRFEAGYKRTDLQTGFHDDTVQPLRVKTTDYSFQQIDWSRQLEDDAAFKLQLYHNRLAAPDRFRTAPISELLGVPPSVVTRLFGVSDQPIDVIQDLVENQYDLDLQHSFRLSANVRIAWGGGARRDEVASPTFIDNRDPVRRDAARLFVNAEWRPTSRILLNAGVMQEWFEHIGASTSPRLALNYRLADQQTLRASASRAWRMPSIFEQFTDFHSQLANTGQRFDTLYQSSGALDPERIDAWELGYIGRLLDNRLLVDINLFHQRIRRLIVDVYDAELPDPIGDGAFRYINSGHLDINGMDAQLQYRPTPHTRLSLALSLAKANGKEPRFPDLLEKTDLANDVPRTTLSIMLTHRFNDDIDASALYYYSSAFQWRGEGDPVDSYGRLDLNIKRQFNIGGNASGHIRFVVQNALNQPYDDFRPENRFGRRFYVELGFIYH